MTPAWVWDLALLLVVPAVLAAIVRAHRGPTSADRAVAAEDPRAAFAELGTGDLGCRHRVDVVVLLAQRGMERDAPAQGVRIGGDRVDAAQRR